MKKIMVLLLLFLTGCTNNILPTPIEKRKTESSMIAVDVRGEVLFPGLYLVSEGTLYYEVIELAGGFTNDAFLDYLPLVSPIFANQTIIVLNKKSSLQDNHQSKIEINLANLNELMALPGIGKTKAKAIIKYRNEFGFFRTIEDILKVPGIGEATFQAIKDLITV